ncbi:MAG: hypothetical protein GY702_25770, partial [Desulfobulbaceae bacterium]|nr:hypothetical protein [Desulfobulbaceae bacterium]
IIHEDGHSTSLQENDLAFLDESVVSAIDPSDALVDEVAQLQDTIAQALEADPDANIDELLEAPAAGGLVDFHDYGPDYHGGDASKGFVGSYLLDSEDKQAPVQYEQVVGDEPQPEEVASTFTLQPTSVALPLGFTTAAASEAPVTTPTTPSIQSVNSPPVITVTANNFTEDDNSTVEGAVAATYETSDADGDDLTVTWTDPNGSPTDGNGNDLYTLNPTSEQVLLTDKGAEFVNAGNDLPVIDLTVTDPGGLSDNDQGDPAVELVNDPPVIEVTANNFTEDDGSAFNGAVAATYETSDEDDDNLTVSWTAASGSPTDVDGNPLYTLTTTGQVLLTDKGAEFVNAGNDLPVIDLTVTDPDGLSDNDQGDPAVELVNDPPVIEVTANNFTEDNGSAFDGAVAATYKTSDEDDDNLTVTWTNPSGSPKDGNNNPLYTLTANGQVLLTEEGAEFVNTGNDLPVIDLTVTDPGGLSDNDQDDPAVELVDDPPVANDFEVEINNLGNPVQVINFDPPSESDRISDEEDDANNIPLHVIITDLPDSGTLYYPDQNGELQPITTLDITNKTQFDHDKITYEANPEGNPGITLLGTKDTASSLDNWGQEISGTERSYDSNGNTITINSLNGNGDPGKDLRVWNNEANHIGYGLSDTDGQGINKNEVINIDFSEQPMLSLQVGLDGLGGHFVDNGISKASITVTYTDGTSEDFLYQKPAGTTGNNGLFQEAAIGEGEVFDTGGKLINDVSFSTDATAGSNWELRYVEGQGAFQDTFKYKSVDSNPNNEDSNEATVTINYGNTVDAIDDPDSSPYSVALGTQGEGGWDGIDSTGEAITITALNADGNEGRLYQSGNNLGVNGSPRTSNSVTTQIEHDKATGTSEAILIKFNGYVNQAEFDVARLFASEGAGGEQARWTAYSNGTPIKTGTFVLNSGHSTNDNTTGNTVNTDNLVFNSLKFDAVEYADGPVNSNDSSDYYVTGVSASGPAEANSVYQTTEDVILQFNAQPSLLNNDLDPNNHAITVTGVDGNGVNEIVTLASGATVEVKADGTFQYNPTGRTDLAAGEVKTDSFEYTITDEFGATDTAIATITVIGAGGGATPDFLSGTEANDIIDSEGGNFIIDAGGGDDTIKLYGNEKSIDGGDGTDTLIVEQEVLDFSKLDTEIDNIEGIDLNNDTTPQTVNLALNDVVEVTDANNRLELSGESDDTAKVETKDFTPEPASEPVNEPAPETEKTFTNDTQPTEVVTVAPDDTNKINIVYTEDGTEI